MTATALEPFSTTVQKSDEWLHCLMEELHSKDTHKAYRVLRATLHALRDRLTPQESAHLAAQLPMLIRGLYYEGYNPDRTPIKERSLPEFLEHISEELMMPTDPSPEVAARLVFRLLHESVSEGEVEDVKDMLPKAVRSLWPA
ncbi:MAG: DUF2267 domain-containing protein [Candidatus Hydrogenedentes bacterium]|nr:DUF2267 domain-containing protein [Candidatus Hydrogenedentota bacterium]